MSTGSEKTGVPLCSFPKKKTEKGRACSLEKTAESRSVYMKDEGRKVRVPYPPLQRSLKRLAIYSAPPAHLRRQRSFYFYISFWGYDDKSLRPHCHKSPCRKTAPTAVLNQYRALLTALLPPPPPPPNHHNCQFTLLGTTLENRRCCTHVARRDPTRMGQSFFKVV